MTEERNVEPLMRAVTRLMATSGCENPRDFIRGFEAASALFAVEQQVGIGHYSVEDVKRALDHIDDTIVLNEAAQRG